MKINVTCKYSVYSSTDIELPEGKTHKDVESVYVKWNTAFIVFKDDPALLEIDMGDIDLETLELKWPEESHVYAIDGDGLPEEVLFSE